MPPVACAYCGGSHARASDVRACWEGAAEPPAPGTAAPEPFAPEPDGTAPDGTGPEATARPPARPVAAAGGRSGPVGGAGPDGLGRNLLAGTAERLPPAWAGCEVVDLDTGGDRLADVLLAAAADRRRLVLRGTPPPPGPPEEREPWRLGPEYRPPGELVAHLARANSVEIDGEGRLRFPLAERAVALGARPAGDGLGDVVLADGRPAFCDGGPVTAMTGDDLGVPGTVVVHRLAVERGSLAPFGTGSPAGVLAPDQLRAVTHPTGAVRVIAPAGSGKTRVLTERARHLVRGWDLPASAVCLVAYNVRAAAEMRERTTDLPGLEVRTLNSLALAVVNGTPPFAPRREQRATIDERDVRDVLATIVDLPRRANSDPAAAWLEALSTVRLALRDPAEVEDEYGGDVDGLPEAFARYRAVLAERRVLDFDEQIYRAVEILVGEPEARASARQACGLLLVDEFQDLTPAHVLLLRLVAGPDAAVFGVGDDDQTIYGYAGASPEWLLSFGRLFPGAGEHALEVNYRCPPTVVAAADRLLRRNRRRVPKRIAPAPERAAADGELLVLTGPGDPAGATGAAMVERTVRRVAALVGEGAAPAEVAVLARVNAALVPVQLALGGAGLPVHGGLGEAWLRRTAVASALAWLRLAVAPDAVRGADLRLALRRPPRGIAPRVVDWVAEQSSLGALERLAQRLTGRDGPKVAGLVDDLRRLGELAASPVPTAELLRVVRDELGLDGAMQSLEGARRRVDRSAQTDDLDALVAAAHLQPDAAAFEGWLAGELRRPPDAGGVVLATVHAVKGREWPHVVVHHATDGVVPHRLATDREEERRVFHVALTRGVATVTVSAGSPPSPFVAELFREPGDDPPEPPPAPAASRATGAAAVGTAPPASRHPAPTVERARVLLREWRRRVATDEKRPAYTVFHDTTLDAIAAELPGSLAALRQVKGVGPAKLERYGDVILALVAEAEGGP